MKKAGIFVLLACSSCMQSVLTYVKAPKPKALFSMSQILEESGLISTDDKAKTIRPAAPDYPTTNFKDSPPRSLNILTHTMETSEGKEFSLKVNTQNRLISTLFYASSGFIHAADKSTPAQGSFVFQAGNKSGEIRIRLYNKDGSLSREEKWFIEVR